MPLPRRRRPSPGTVLGAIALFVALGGTALAATGQLVNIADGTNAGYLARVDSAGALKTTTYAPPFKTFNLNTSVYDDSVQTYNGLFTPTTATVALNSIVIAPNVRSVGPRAVSLYWVSVNTGSSCSSGSTLDFKIIGTYRVNTETVVDSKPTPLILRAPSGKSWCLLANQYTPGDSSGAQSTTLTLTGQVQAGSAPSGTTTLATTSQTSQTTATGDKLTLETAHKLLGLDK